MITLNAVITVSRGNRQSGLGSGVLFAGPEGAVHDETEKARRKNEADGDEGQGKGGSNGETAPKGGT
ncbi:MAG: hypothetical protein F4W95_05100 [Chloroflexi bacterium]|nr:hypothetical protein [Chloroflexota bacterium]MYD47846.1 hypothetical protein [Chloroflexota bacterium]